MSPRPSASRIPGCQRIALRLRAELARTRQLLVLCERAFGPRTASRDQQAFVTRVADSLERRVAELDQQLAHAARLPGAPDVSQHRARRVRKRQPDLEGFQADQRWMVEAHGE